MGRENAVSIVFRWQPELVGLVDDDDMGRGRAVALPDAPSVVVRCRPSTAGLRKTRIL